MSGKFVYKFEMTEEDWLRIHGKLDEAIRLLHELANDDDTVSEAIEADDALSDLENAIDDYGFKYESEEEPKMSEERITLEMDMQDYGYIVNVFKSMQRNVFVGRAIAGPYMAPNIDMCLDILSNSEVVKEDVTPNKVVIKALVHTLTEAANAVANGTADSGTIVDILDTASTLGTMFLADDEPKSKSQIEMSEEEWNKIRNGAMPETKTKKVRLKKPISGTYPWKELNEKIDIIEETVKKQADMISELYEMTNVLKEYVESNKNRDAISKLENQCHTRLNLIGRELYDFKNKVASDFASIDNRFSDYDERIAVLRNKTDRLHEMCEANDSRRTGLHIKLDNKIDILEERLKNTAETIDSVKTQLEEMNNLKDNIKSNGYDVNALDRKFDDKFDRLDEQMKTLSHKMNIHISFYECLFNKLHLLKDDMKELAQSNADKYNRLAKTVSNLKDSIECSKEDKNKLDISSASFNIYFDKNKKEDDDE